MLDLYREVAQKVTSSNLSIHQKINIIDKYAQLQDIEGLNTLMGHLSLEMARNHPNSAEKDQLIDYIHDKVEKIMYERWRAKHGDLDSEPQAGLANPAVPTKVDK
jgi:hypothetical protein